MYPRITKAIVLLMFAASCILIGSAQAEIVQSPKGYQYLSDKMIIGLEKGVPKLNTGDFTTAGFSTGLPTLDALCEQNGVVSIEPWYKGELRNAVHLKDVVERMYIVTTNEAKDINAVTTAFSSDRNLEYAALYDIPVPSYQPNDPYINQQWYLAQINAYEAWDLVRGEDTEPVIIGISDTGVYTDHPDLIPNFWINEPEDLNGNGEFDNYPETEGGDLNDLDDDGNGYDDDVVGYDFGWGDPDPSEDDPTHGTHVAGCASEATDNELGGAGPGFGAKIIAAKGARGGSLVAVYQAITYSAEQGAHFCNCSWGSNYYNQGYQNLVSAAYEDGCLVIAAAGNDNTSQEHYPAAYRDVLAVAATQQNDLRASFTNYGDWVHISAPGVSIYTTWAHDTYTSLGGTSMASPITAGVAALIQAQELTRLPQDVWDIITAYADSVSLYTANPGWEGLLGSGRVDAFASLAGSDYPNIVLLDTEHTITNDDGDGVLNPGEDIELVVSIQNIWADAANVTGELSGSDYMDFTDATTDFGDIAGGETVDNSSDPFILSIHADCPVHIANLTLDITADGGYQKTIEFPLEILLNQQNFPLTVDGNLEGAMAFYDLDGNGNEEVIFGTAGEKIFAIDADGNNLPGFPVDVDGDINNGIAIGHVTGDASAELVTVTKSGNIYVIHNDGQIASGFPISAGSAYYGTPTLVDIDNDAMLDMFFPCFSDGQVYGYDGSGAGLDGFPVDTGDKFYGSLAVGDIDDDGNIEIVGGTLSGQLHAWNHDGSPVDGFPIDLGSQIWISPSLGDLTFDMVVDIVIGTQDGDVYAFEGDGSGISGFPVNIGSSIKSDLVTANVRYDQGGVEIVAANNSSELYLINQFGEIVSGFPVEMGSSANSSPVVADMDADGLKEIMVAAKDGAIYGFNHDGNVLRNFPIPTYGTLTTSSLALGDMDGDNDIEMAVGLRQVADNLIVIDYKTETELGSDDWIMYGYNTERHHRWLESLTGIDEGIVNEIPTEFELLQNYPNPFNPETKIYYNLPENTKVELVVFNVMGQEVANLVNGVQPAGRYTVTWDGLNQNGTGAATGLYFYRLNTDNHTAVKKMLLIR